MPVSIDISSEFSGWDCCGFSIDETINRAITATLNQNHWRDLFRNKDAEISILLCDDDFIRNLNKEYRKKDKPTNVLSFPQTDFKDLKKLPDYLTLGDVILSFQALEQEAKDQGKRFEDHFTHLIIHGTLHLMGYDHETSAEATEMEELETEILRQLGIENPYADSGFVA